MSYRFAILDGLPKVALDALRRGSKDIHSRIDGGLIAAWKIRVGRVHHSRFFPSSDNRQLVFEPFSAAEISLRKVGQDLVLYVIEIENDYYPIKRILSVCRPCVGPLRMTAAGHDRVDDCGNVPVKLPSSRETGSLWGKS